jgi:prepilin-type N-terminal cleavage/methylation domain-containing protein
VKRADASTAEDGFTLIEMIIAISVLGLIIGPIVGSFLLGILEADSTRDRIADSASAQVTTAYLLGDVQSSQLVVTNASTGSACLSGEAAAGTNQVPIQFTWTDPDDGPVVVSYVVHDPPASDQLELYRSTCTPGDSPVLLVQHVASTGGVILACLDDDGVALGSCAGEPRTVTVTIRAESLDPPSQSSYDPLTFEITAERRVS